MGVPQKIGPLIEIVRVIDFKCLSSVHRQTKPYARVKKDYL